MGIQSDIFVGVIKYLESFASIPVAVPNRTYGGARPYYRLSILPAFTSTVGVSSLSRNGGILQIDAVVDEDIGVEDVGGHVDTIIETIKRPLIITENTTKIRFTQVGYPGPPVPGVNEYTIPVTIPYTVLQGA